LRLILVCSTFPVFSVRLRLGCVLLRRGERIQTIDEAAVPSRNQVDIFLRCDLDGTVSHLIANVWQRSACLMNPSKVIELFKLGEGSSPTLGIKTADVVDGFCSFLGLPRLVNSVVVCALDAENAPTALSSGDDFKNGQKTPCLRTAGTYAILAAPAAGWCSNVR
jgi:hypothetical protein